MISRLEGAAGYCHKAFIHVQCVLNHESHNQCTMELSICISPKVDACFLSLSQKEREDDLWRLLLSAQTSGIVDPVFSQWADDTFLTGKLDYEESVTDHRSKERGSQSEQEEAGEKNIFRATKAVLFTVLMLCLGTDVVTPVSHQLGWDQRAVGKITRGGDQGRTSLIHVATTPAFDERCSPA